MSIFEETLKSVKLEELFKNVSSATFEVNTEGICYPESYKESIKDDLIGLGYDIVGIDEDRTASSPIYHFHIRKKQ